ncbi:endonuclease/exonuclease/phosphatase family protein [Chromobacterium haemolyticum]|uniref:endonuclease/exonuclease/phosphatase family protein n=1 Tax=Chromobacterium haemolyticum TaxID=394935 RepID=UPI000584973B|nr:endonuclease/exonuclease/phosphatase family protein [Chromobacterium haemolyticum]
MKSITVVTYNIHKGMSPLNRHVRLGDMASALESIDADVLFLQEVQGKNIERALQHASWPKLPQHHFLARRLDHKAAYGLNAAYEHGHHGNALLTRFPINTWCNRDISVNRFESRGLLHCQLTPAGWKRPVVTLCGHFNLLARDRRKQFLDLARYVRENVPEDAPLILAGDFNDWREEATDHLMDSLGLVEVFDQLFGRHARSFPARMPMLPLDRIYVRGLKPLGAEVLKGAPWSRLSDHLPLSASLVPV